MGWTYTWTDGGGTKRNRNRKANQIGQQQWGNGSWRWQGDGGRGASDGPRGGGSRGSGGGRGGGGNAGRDEGGGSNQGGKITRDRLVCVQCAAAGKLSWIRAEAREREPQCRYCKAPWPAPMASTGSRMLSELLGATAATQDGGGDRGEEAAGASTGAGAADVPPGPPGPCPAAAAICRGEDGAAQMLGLFLRTIDRLPPSRWRTLGKDDLMQHLEREAAKQVRPVPVSSQFHQATVAVKRLDDQIAKAAKLRTSEYRLYEQKKEEADKHLAEARKQEKHGEELEQQRTKLQQEQAKLAELHLQ